jgi:hypothetical protein
MRWSDRVCRDVWCCTRGIGDDLEQALVQKDGSMHYMLLRLTTLKLNPGISAVAATLGSPSTSSGVIRLIRVTFGGILQWLPAIAQSIGRRRNPKNRLHMLE